MTVEDIKIPYEILIRFDGDGVPYGAHVQYLRRVKLDTGEILKEELLNAEPIDLEGFPTNSIMTDITKSALATISAQSEKISQLTQEIASLRDSAGLG